MDTLTLMIGIYPTVVKKELIVDIENGKAKTSTGRWYDIVCDQCEIDYEQVDEAKVPYIVCNICNKITYIKDLMP